MRALFLTRPRNLGSALIRAREGSTASHCALMLADGSVIESVWPRARAHSGEDWARHCALHAIVTVDSIPLALMDEPAAESAARAMVGLPYGLLGLLGFLLWRDMEDERAPYCSQMVRAVLIAGRAYRPRDPGLRRFGVAMAREVCGLMAD